METKQSRKTTIAAFDYDQKFFVVNSNGTKINRLPIEVNDVLRMVTRYESNHYTFDEMLTRFEPIANSYAKGEATGVILEHDKTFDFTPPKHFVKSDRNSKDNVQFWVLEKWDNEKSTFPDLYEHLQTLGYTLDAVNMDEWTMPKKKIKGVKNREIEKYLRDKKKKDSLKLKLDDKVSKKGETMLKEYERITGHEFI